MAASELILALLVPGLCGSDAGVSLPEDERPRALQRLLSRSAVRHHAIRDLDGALGSFFGLDADAGHPLPVAPLTSLADTGKADGHYILRADPVHLRADRSSLRLFDSHTFGITREEADALVDAFNELYADRGWCLQAPVPQRWYLHMPRPPVLVCTPPRHIAGRDIDAGLPRGADARHWHALLNEVQMCFHEHPVNTARTARGEPAINSLWFWGGGVLPEPVPSPGMHLAGDHPLARGLAHWSGTPCHEVPENAEEWLANAESGLWLVVHDGLETSVHYGEVDAWMEGLRQLERDWFGPLLDHVRKRRIDRLEIHPCNGRSYLTDRQRQRCFWRRDRTLESICHDD